MNLGPEYITNLTNYSGLFQTGVSYEKFDIVYNTGDARFYYARDDMTYGGGAVMEGSNRFFLEPDGPQENGMPTHYIFDELNELTTINNQVEVGQVIHLTGSLFGSDGYYKVLDYERDLSSPEEDTSNGTIEGALDLTILSDNWYQSSWFMLANGGTDQELDATIHFSPKGSPGWYYNTFLGWLYVSLTDAPGNQVWFWINNPGRGQGNTASEGYWMWSSSEVMVSNNVNQGSFEGSFVFLDSGFGNDFGPIGNWLHWQKSHLPEYAAIFYNYGSAKWYGMARTNSKIDVLDRADIPPAVPSDAPSNRLKDGISARIQVQGIDEDTIINQYEEPSSNFISIKSIVQDLSSEQSSWSKDLFFFDADYGSTVNFKANNYKYEYGNGYYTLQPKSINALSFEANLQFKNRTNREANAIIHFLENHQGQHEKDKPSATLKYSQGISGFRWDGNATFHPYDSPDVQTKNFYCQQFSHSLNFENSNNLNVKLVNYDTSILRKSDGLFVRRPEDYSTSGEYGLNDVVFDTGNHQYYYCHSGDGFDTLSGLDPVLMSDEWSRESGNFQDINTGFWTREFFWQPSIGLNVAQNPRMNHLTFGGAYNQIYKDGINESLLNLDLSFNNRSDEEAYSIIHFLEQHYGSTPFQFSPPAPYEAKKNFVCQEWSHTYNFKDNHSISAKFEEFPINLSSQRLLNNSTPSPKTPAEIIMSSIFIIGDEDDNFLWNETQRRRVTIENIGGSDATIDSLFFGSGSENFSIIGKKTFGETYIEASFDGSENIDATNIAAIYLDIVGSAITSEISDYYLSKRNWTTRDLAEAILNRADFLSLAPDARIVNILYLDLLNRVVGGGEDISAWLALDSVSEVISGIVGSEEYINLKKNDIKVISKKINLNSMKVIIPDHKMRNLNLNGIEVTMSKYNGNTQEFKRTDNGVEYIQYNNGSVFEKNKGKAIQTDYFVNDKIFKMFGSNVLEANASGFIDIKFENENKNLNNDYLIDSDGNIITWTDSFNEAQGYIKIETTNTWVYADLNLNWVGAQLTSVVKTWIAGEHDLQKQIRNNPWFIDINDAHQNYLDKSLALIPAPRIYIPNDQYALVQDNCKIPIATLLTSWGISIPNANISSLTNAEREAIENVQGAIVRNEEIEIELDFVPKNPDKAIFFEGMWVPYEVILYNTDDGGMLLPREINNTNINEISSWVESENLNFRTVINDSNHTVLSVEELDYRNPSPDLPAGYSQAVKQIGMCKITEDILDSSSSLIGKRARIKTKLIGNTSILGNYKKGGAGNLEVSIGKDVAEYGIIEQQNAVGDQIVFKYEITGTSVDNPLNRTVDGIRSLDHPDFETWAKSGTSIDLLGVAVFGDSSRTLAQDIDGYLTSGRAYRNYIHSHYRTKTNVFAFEPLDDILTYWIDNVAAQTIEPSSAPTYDITFSSDIHEPWEAPWWGMFKVNGVYVPDMPEFVEWLHNNYPSGIPYSSSVLRKWGISTYDYTLRMTWSGYDDLLSGNLMHGGSGGGVAGGIPWYTQQSMGESYYNFAKYYAMFKILPSQLTGDQAMIDLLLENTIIGKFLKDLQGQQETFNPVKYKIIDKSGNLHQAFSDIPQAILEWRRLKDEKFFSRRIVFEDELGEIRKFSHVVSLNAIVDQNGESYLDSDSMNQLSAINQAYSQMPHAQLNGPNGNYDQVIYGIERSPIPENTPSGTGLKINPFYYIDLTEEQKREVELAISKVESIVSDDITMNIYISEDPGTRLGSSFDQNVTATLYTDKNEDYIVGGMKSVDGSNYSRRIGGIYTINPARLFNFDFNKDVDETYEPEKLSPLYYTTLHELIHLLGVGNLWSWIGIMDLTRGNTLYSAKFIQNTSPGSSTAVENDFWFNPDDLKIYKYLSGAWVEQQNSEAVYFFVKSIAYTGFSNAEVDYWIGMDDIYLAKYGLVRSEIIGGVKYIGEHAASEFESLCSFNNIIHDQSFNVSFQGMISGSTIGKYNTKSIPLGPVSKFVKADHISEGPFQYKNRDDVIDYSPSFANEIMTTIYGIKESNPAILSRVTIGLIEDLGYSVDYNQAKPNNDPYLQISLPEYLL